MDIFNYSPRPTHKVQVGDTPLGGDSPLRLQSMTTTPTADVEASVAQCKTIIDAGADYVRLTAQGMREAQSLKSIRAALRCDGYAAPLVADIHFNPAVADEAAKVVEKVRINPGNYVDPARTFKHLEYTDEEYCAELQRLEERFKKFLDICKTNHTAIRIGVNHGSLSDRIMSRYGDTPAGIVESCMEFLRICERENFKDVVVSIKASNTGIMVRSVRLLCREMEKEHMDYPLHLGVTEAGEGEDGRIKSAAGIGALLSDGIGDTLRVSLSESPEVEVPVAYKLASYVVRRAGHPFIPAKPCPIFNYVDPVRRPTCSVANIGGTHAPVVIGVRLDGNNTFSTQLPDYVYCGRALPEETKRVNCRYIVDADVWTPESGAFPVYSVEHLFAIGANPSPLKFLFLTYPALTAEVLACLRQHSEIAIIAQSNHANRLGELRALVHELWNERITNPVIIFEHYAHSSAEKETFQLEAAADAGALLFDGLADGLMLYNNAENGITPAQAEDTAYAILQATRTRITRTEYISCPGCGRTLYNLPATIARIKAATAHLKGLKIGIMGCIVNGPGEMADADYGYVGAARGKVSLYKGKTCVEKNIPEDEAVEKLLDLINKTYHP